MNQSEQAQVSTVEQVVELANIALKVFSARVLIVAGLIATCLVYAWAGLVDHTWIGVAISNGFALIVNLTTVSLQGD